MIIYNHFDKKIIFAIIMQLHTFTKDVHKTTAPGSFLPVLDPKPIADGHTGSWTSQSAVQIYRQL
jgi:hypothetical protein